MLLGVCQKEKARGSQAWHSLAILHIQHCGPQNHIHSICYPQNCGRMLSPRVPAVTGHRQSRESLKHLSSMANHSSLTSPPGSILFCSHAALRYQNSSVLTTQRYLDSLHQDAWLSEGIQVAFLFCFTSERQPYTRCKNTEKPTGLIRGTVKQGGEMGLV